MLVPVFLHTRYFRWEKMQWVSTVCFYLRGSTGTCYDYLCCTYAFSKFLLLNVVICFSAFLTLYFLIHSVSQLQLIISHFMRLVGTPASLSCGSMTLTSSPVHAADIHVATLPSPPAITSVSPGTSVTSSPQHFYPQENHFPRAGKQNNTHLVVPHLTQGDIQTLFYTRFVDFKNLEHHNVCIQVSVCAQSVWVLVLG